VSRRTNRTLFSWSPEARKGSKREAFKNTADVSRFKEKPSLWRALKEQE
jgi:hypothetical protein